MERLTEKHYGAAVYYMKCSADPQCDGACGNCSNLEQRLNLLGAYEETGLTPEQVAALMADLKKVDTDCSFCAHNATPAPCEGTDNMCDQCTEDCVCKTCRDNSNWVWCPPDKRVKHGKRT